MALNIKDLAMEFLLTDYVKTESFKKIEQELLTKHEPDDDGDFDDDYWLERQELTNRLLQEVIKLNT
jgi:hypothetical protein